MSRYDGGYDGEYESDTSRLRHGREKRRDARDVPRGPPSSNRGFDYINQLASERSRNGSDSASRAGTERSDRSDRTARRNVMHLRKVVGPGLVLLACRVYTAEDVERRRRERAKYKNVVVREPPIRGSDAPSSYEGEGRHGGMDDTRSHHSNNTITPRIRSGESRYSDINDTRSHHSNNTITPNIRGGESRHGGMNDTRSRHSNSTITPSSHRRTPSVAASSRGPSGRSRRDDVAMLSERARDMQLGEPEDPADEEARRRKVKGIEKWRQQQELDRFGIEKPVKPGPSSVISGASSLVRPGESVDGRDLKMEKLSAAGRGSSVYSGVDPSNYSRDSRGSRDRHLAVPSYAPSYHGSSTSSRRSARDYDYYDDEDGGYAPPAAAANVMIINDTVMNNRSSNSSQHIRRSGRREKLRRGSFSDSDY
ncbi:hypothetical protein OCU04_003583 [Sclerotinia nivalis]|uniref:Uncharacterized protein n=1 Tax=Sclerotinia nivalis TaxID=352851 RepID=A0A9X0ASM5_9HELO|nr:hypothetical protein OCU04_003583 [Sclerotinia nivalis]